MYFMTWDGYVDQDQDHGYGICSGCQDDAEERLKEHYEKTWQTLLSAITKQETRDKLIAEVEADPEMKIVYVNMAIDKGLLKWTIN
jgi:hypothetical protein